MRHVACPHCRRTFSEADAGWDRAYATGACPNCGKLLDAAREQQAALKAHDPFVVRYSRSVRLTALALGITSLVASAPLLTFGRIRYASAGLMFSVFQFGIAIFFTPRAAARRRLKRATDLERFATEREAPRS